MKLGSLFDGIGGWLLAAERNWIEPVWASEIDKFCIAVTKHHFPNVMHLGSVTDIDGAEVEPVDIITSGSPCQDLSVAGLRKGLEGERSGLFYDSIRLVRRMRAATGGKFPKFYVWENVPGAFSSNQGRDFLAVLEALTEANLPMPGSGRWANAGMVRSRVCDCAWRTLDAQYWGVAQRRKRIFLIADFREPRERRPEILFESESVSGNFETGREEGQGAAKAADGCFALAGNTIDRKPTNGGNGCGFQSDVSYTLTSMDRHAVAIRERCGCEGGGKGLLYGDDVSHTLATSNDQFVTYDMTHANDVIRENGKAVNTLQSRMGTGGNQVPVVVGTLMARDFKGLSVGDCYGKAVPSNHGVRRLTPLECERLQGLPDGWTDIPHKTCSDSARYKAIGNGMAQPCPDYILSVVRRMAE